MKAADLTRMVNAFEVCAAALFTKLVSVPTVDSQ
jgi:hypothetical protein